MSFDTYLIAHDVDENHPSRKGIMNAVRFLQSFEFLDATDETDEELAFAKQLVNGYLVVSPPVFGGIWMIRHYLDADTKLQEFAVQNLQTAIPLIGGMLAMCLSPVPAQAANDVVKPAIAEVTVPAYFGDPIFIANVVNSSSCEKAMQDMAEEHGAAVWIQLSLDSVTVTGSNVIGSKTLDQCLRISEALPGWQVISTCVHSTHQIIEEPVVHDWSTAKEKCIELAEKHGHAVVVDEGDGINVVYRIIAAATASDVVDLLGDTPRIAMERSRDFPQHNIG